MKYGFGIDVGGTTVKLAFFSEFGDMIAAWEIPTNTQNGGERILPEIAASVEAYMAHNGVTRSEVLGIGIGVPGPVDEKGIVNHCVNLGWGVKDLVGELEALTGMTVRAGNDANVAALGECWRGGGEGCRNMVMATLGTGVGGGIVVGGQVIHGVHGAGGEIGHLTLNPEETRPCGCGKYGCAEQYCSATGIVRVARDYLAAHAGESALREKAELTCKDIFDAGKAGDGAALAILEQVYEYLGRFLANVCCVVDPEVVVIGGGVSKAGQVLIDGIRKYYLKYIFHAIRPVRFALAKLGNDAGAYGAFKLVLDAENA